MNYFKTNYYYLNLKVDKKFKNKKIYDYIDKDLKQRIYTINNGLLTNSFIRKEQSVDSTFTKTILNVSLIPTFLNKWGLLYVYPMHYNNKMVKHVKKQQLFFKRYYFNKKFIHTLNFFKLKRNLKYVYWELQDTFVKKRKLILFKKIFKRKKIFRTYLIKKTLKKFKWTRYFLDYKGGYFTLKRGFIKRNTKIYLFRDEARRVYYRFTKGYILLLKTINRFNTNNFLLSKLYIYLMYVKYLYAKLFKLFSKFRFIRKNSYFGSYYFNRRFKLKMVEKQLKKIIINKNNLKEYKKDIYYFLLHKNNMLLYYYWQGIWFYNSIFPNYIKHQIYLRLMQNNIVYFYYFNSFFYYQNKLFFKIKRWDSFPFTDRYFDIRERIQKGKWQDLEREVDKKKKIKKNYE